MGDSGKGLSQTRLVDKAERAFPKDFADAVRVRASGGSNSGNTIIDDVREQAYSVDAISEIRFY